MRVQIKRDRFVLKSFEAVSYCDLAQNLETVQFLISKKDLDKLKL